MTPCQIELVQASWSRVEPIADTVARLFYRRLFELAPDVRPLFKTSISEQSDRLIVALSEAVDGLGRGESLRPAAEPLGLRPDESVGLPEQYDTVGDALLWALEHGLGTAFTAEVRAAWSAAYVALAGVMLDASMLGEAVGRSEAVAV